MKTRSLICLSLALSLTACNSARDRTETTPAPQVMADYEAQDGQFSKVANSAPSDDASPSRPASEPGNPSAQSFLAYRYNYGFALPVKIVGSTAKSHADMCLEAGPAKCQILSSNTSRNSPAYVNAHLSLRAEPEWLKGFQERIESSVEDAKGEMTHSGVSAEDLTRSILDTDARLKAQKTLRTRLENLLETRDAKLPDFLALEREFARVQGQIESATTTLNVLRKRVSMSVVDINYQTKQVAVSHSSLSPISRSLKRFTGNIAEGIGSVIEFFSYLLPWLLLVILPGLWVIRWMWRRRKSKPVKA